MRKPRDVSLEVAVGASINIPFCMSMGIPMGIFLGIPVGISIDSEVGCCKRELNLLQQLFVSIFAQRVVR